MRERQNSARKKIILPSVTRAPCSHPSPPANNRSHFFMRRRSVIVSTEVARRGVAAVEAGRRVRKAERERAALKNIERIRLPAALARAPRPTMPPSQPPKTRNKSPWPAMPGGMGAAGRAAERLRKARRGGASTTR